MQPVLADEHSLALACEHLAAGRLVGVPTETVYGLAANAFDPLAVRRIYTAKGRPDNNPLIVHVAGSDQLPDVVDWPLDAETGRLLDAIIDLWPGPLTVVLPRARRIPDEVTAGLSTVAVRIPKHPVMQSLLTRCGFPVAAPSANRSKYVSPTTAQHVVDGLGDQVAMVLDGGRCSVGLESTIVSLRPSPRILRPGTVTAEMLAKRWGVPAASLLPSGAKSPAVDEPAVLEAPGMMLQHYSPTTRLAFADDATSSTKGQVGRIAFAPLPDSRLTEYAVVRVLSQSGDLMEVASGLFAALRELDQLQLDWILVDRCSSDGIGRAIMDRLTRAVANH
ncbi:MAG: L-threonylcarbamoyladenylate synthase [Pirellulaceae bacterium]